MTTVAGRRRAVLQEDLEDTRARMRELHSNAEHDIDYRLTMLRDEFNYALNILQSLLLEQLQWITRSNGQKNRVKKGGKK